jgi:GAF domain-containing protein/two-component sensor histidine kinase
MLRGLYDSAPIMMGVVELLEQDILHVTANEAGARFVGLPSQAFRNVLASKLGTSPQTIRAWMEHCRDSARLRQPRQFEVLHETPRSVRCLSVTVSHMGEGVNSPPRFGYVAQDVTGQREAQETLKARYRQLQSFYFISQMLLGSSGLRSTLDAILDEVLASGAYDIGAVGFLRRATYTIETSALKGYLGSENHRPDATGVQSAAIGAEATPLDKNRAAEALSKADAFLTFQSEGVKAAVTVPIHIGAELVGVLQAGSRTRARFQEDEIRLLESFAGQIGIAVQQHRFREESQRHLRQVQALYEIEKAVSSTLDLRDVLDILLEKIDLLLPYSGSQVALWSETAQELTPVAFRNFDGEEWRRGWSKRARGFTWMVFESQTPVVARNIQQDPRSRDPEFARRHGWRSYLGVPLKAHGERLGVLGFFTKEEHEFSGEEIQTLWTVGSLAAMAIQNSRLYEQAKQSAQELSGLYNVTAAASQSLNPDQVFQEVIRKITEIFRFDATGIFLLDPDREYLHLQASIENWPGNLSHLKVFPRGCGIVGRVAQTGEPLVFENVADDPIYRDLSLSRSVLRIGFSFLAAYPIKRKDQTLGVLLCTGKQPRTPSLHDTRLLTSMANQIGVAVQNMHLYEETKRQALQLRASREQLRQFAAHLQSVREEERTEIAREIHDELGQALTGLKLDLFWLKRKLPQEQSLLTDKIDGMARLLDQTIQGVRGIATRLRPSVLDLGLTAAIEWQLGEFQSRTANACKVSSCLEEIQLDRQRSTALFRIFQEALTNIARHAKASSVEINLEERGHDVVLQVSDNGVGIESGRIQDPKSLGLLGMRERALLLGGQVMIRRNSATGTTVIARLPTESLM